MAYSFSAHEFDEYLRDQQRRAREHERMRVQAENAWWARQMPARLPDVYFQQTAENQQMALNKSSNEAAAVRAHRKPDLRVLLCQ